jgi:hypothetical protein
MDIHKFVVVLKLQKVTSVYLGAPHSAELIWVYYFDMFDCGVYVVFVF